MPLIFTENFFSPPLGSPARQALANDRNFAGRSAADDAPVQVTGSRTKTAGSRKSHLLVKLKCLLTLAVR